MLLSKEQQPASYSFCFRKDTQSTRVRSVRKPDILTHARKCLVSIRSTISRLGRMPMPSTTYSSHHRNNDSGLIGTVCSYDSVLLDMLSTTIRIGVLFAATKSHTKSTLTDLCTVVTPITLLSSVFHHLEAYRYRWV